MLRLPAYAIDLGADPPVIRASGELRRSDPHRLRGRERRALLALDRGSTRPSWTVERVVPLVDGRWAVGRRSGDHVLWRVVTADALDRLGHPAWLWASDDWLDPHQAATPSFPTPARLPLRTLVAHAAALHPSGRDVIKALAACVRNLRGGQPTALVVDREALDHAAHPARCFLLALFTLLPPSWRAPLHVAVGEPDPSPHLWTLVITDHPVDGYQIVDLDLPDDEGADLVAYYVRERLLADDPEALEAAAFRTPPVPAGRGGSLGDPWAEAVAAVLRDPAPGIAAIDDLALERDPEGAIRALTARLAARAALDAEVGGGTLLERLVAITRATRDPRPWLALGPRPARERALAIGAALKGPLRPTAALIDALVEVYPPGADLGPWVDALLDWLRRGIAPATVVRALEHTLLSWPTTRAASTRASVWSEVVQSLVTLGEDEAAMDALLSPVARRLAEHGAGAALASLWSVVPEAFRDPERLDALVQLLATAPDRDEAIVALYQHARGTPRELDRLFRAWHTARADVPASEQAHDPLFEAVRGSPRARGWLDGLFAARDPVHAAEAIAAVASGSADPLWVEAELALSQAMGLGPGQRLFSIPVLGGGIDAIEPHATLWLLDALPRPFPCEELTGVARWLLTASTPSPLWSLVAVTAAPVDSFEDDVIDAAVVDFCAAEALPDEVREAALACVEQLGAAEGFEPLDLARWMVRISLAPDGTRVTPELTLALIRGVLSRPDGLAYLEAITRELLELPPEHPALLAFVHFLLPRAWEGGVPARFRDAIPLDAIPVALRPAWCLACRIAPC